MSYAERLQKRIEKTGSRLCVGLDPRPGEEGPEFARNFLKQVIEETAVWAAAFKPNMAYFEAMGIEGIRLLEDLLAGMPEVGSSRVDLQACKLEYSIVSPK